MGNQGWELHATLCWCTVGLSALSEWVHQVSVAVVHVFIFSFTWKCRCAAFGCGRCVRSSPVCSHKKQHENGASDLLPTVWCGCEVCWKVTVRAQLKQRPICFPKSENVSSNLTFMKLFIFPIKEGKHVFIYISEMQDVICILRTCYIDLLQIHGKLATVSYCVL